MLINSLESNLSTNSQGFDKFSADQISFIRKLIVPLRVRIKGAEIDDDEFVLTDLNEWKWAHGGNIHSINFDKFQGIESVLVKWLLAKFLRTLSSGYTVAVYYSFRNYFSFENNLFFSRIYLSFWSLYTAITLALTTHLKKPFIYFLNLVFQDLTLIYYMTWKI